MYYKFRKISGVVYESTGDSIHVEFRSRNKLRIDSCQNPELDTFLRTLTLGRHGRTELEHLLTTSANITINISNKVGIMHRDGKYRVIAGMTWLENGDSTDLMVNEASRTAWSKVFNPNKYVHVYEHNRIEIFRGSIEFANDTSFKLTKHNVSIFEWEEGDQKVDFDMDTIQIEPFLHPELLYKNMTELYYFGGLHEIFHTRPENIKIQENGGDQEWDAFELELKAFKQRNRINRKHLKF